MENKEKELARIREQMISAMGRAFEIRGLNGVTGRLYGLLFLSEEPMTLDDMAQQLGMSKPSMSIHVRNLEKSGMVHKVWKRGGRKNYYVAETDMEKIIQEIIEREKAALNMLISTANDCKINLKKLKKEQNHDFQKNVAQNLDKVLYWEECWKSSINLLDKHLPGNKNYKN